jgi:hypothetical protein
MNPTRINLISEGVVASYIHDISARTSPTSSPATAARDGGRAARVNRARAALAGVPPSRVRGSSGGDHWPAAAFRPRLAHDAVKADVRR